MAILRLCIALLVCRGLASATTIKLTSLDTQLGLQDVWINENGTPTDIGWMGGVIASINNTYIRTLWCVQLFVNISLNTTYNTTIDFADTPNLKRVGWLMANVIDSVTTTTQGAAFQLAIWDIMEDSGDGFSAGKVRQSTDLSHQTLSGVLTQAQAYELMSLSQSFTYVPVYHNVTLQGAARQNLIGPLEHDGGPVSEAPEPAALALILGGLALIVAGRWRKTRR